MITISAKKILERFGFPPNWKKVEKEMDMSTKEILLKVKTGSSDAFVNEKRKQGFSSWTFQELVLYKGYEAARKDIDRMKRIPAYKNCALVKSYYHVMGDAYVIDLKLHGKELSIITDKEGTIISEEGFGEHFRDYEKRIPELETVMHMGAFKADYKDRIVTKMKAIDETNLTESLEELKNLEL